MERPVVVLDNGASVTKIGEAGDEAPWEWVDFKHFKILQQNYVSFHPEKDNAFNSRSPKALGPENGPNSLPQ